MFAATIFTLYPDFFPGPLGQSLSGDGLARGLWSLEMRNIRDHGLGRHRAVDDTPAGGGPGMVIRADVLAASLDEGLPPQDTRPRLLMSPRGRPLTQARVRELAAGPGAIIVCGRFEGVDQRVIGLEQYADLRPAEECELGQRRLREAEQEWSGRVRHFQDHDTAARRGMRRLG